MRLTSLSRKLGVSRDEILSFLKSNKIEVSEGVNAKISDEDAVSVIEHFGIPETKIEDELPASEQKKTHEPEPETNIKEAEEQNDSKEEEKQEGVSKDLKEESPEETGNKKGSALVKDEVPRPEEDESLEEFLERQKVDLIRAKKIKLEGVKVVGKIDLPEPKAPKEKAEKEVDLEEERKKEKEKEKEEKPKGLYAEYLEKKKRPYEQRRKKRRPKKVLSFEEKQQLEQKKIEREKEKKQKQLKRKKELYYKENIQPKVKKKPKTKSEEVSREKKHESKPVQKQAKKSKSVIGRLWGWLNGEYDKF